MDGQRADTPLLPTAEAAARLGVSVRQFARLCRAHGVAPDGHTTGQVRSNLYSEAAICYLLQETGKANHDRTDVQVVTEQTDGAVLLRQAIDAALAPLVAELAQARQAAEAAHREALDLAERAALAEARADALAEELARARKPWWKFW